MPLSVSAPRAAHRAQDERAQRLRRRVGTGRVEHRARDHPLGQVVEALEALARRRSTGRRGPRASRARASPASSSTSRRRPRPRSGASRAARGRGSPQARAPPPPGARAAPARGCPSGRAPRIRQRNSGKSSTGSRLASCAQYSKTRPSPEQPGHRARRVDADPRGEHDAVAALDRGDRVELHAGQAADGRLDLVGAARPARVAKPWWATTWRRRAAREIVAVVTPRVLLIG